MSKSVDFWYLRISRSAKALGRERRFLTPPVFGALLRAACKSGNRETAKIDKNSWRLREMAKLPG